MSTIVSDLNSHYIAQRIQRAYHRESTVIYPPVDIGYFDIGQKREDFYLTASRMVSYKKIDLIVEAQACGTPVIALGKGGAVETVRGVTY